MKKCTSSVAFVVAYCKTVKFRVVLGDLTTGNSKIEIKNSAENQASIVINGYSKSTITNFRKQLKTANT